jgi:hypothetical protein
MVRLLDHAPAESPDSVLHVTAAAGPDGAVEFDHQVFAIVGGQKVHELGALRLRKVLRQVAVENTQAGIEVGAGVGPDDERGCVGCHACAAVHIQERAAGARRLERELSLSRFFLSKSSRSQGLQPQSAQLPRQRHALRPLGASPPSQGRSQGKSQSPRCAAKGRVHLG